MIDVPVEVKDALREGTYKKNYRFVVYRTDVTVEYNDLTTLNTTTPSYTLTEACDFNKLVVLHAPKAETAQTFIGWVKWPSNARQPFTFNVGTEEDAYLEITYGILDVGTQIYITQGPQDGEIGLTTTDRIVTTSTEVEDFTIDNDNLVSESVSIDERMCSGDTWKVGLCEGSSLEFQYFNKPNITGKRVQAFVDVEYGADEPYTIPMGFFDVKKCSRQASTGIIKATCYNKLQSEYLDAKANSLLEDAFTESDRVMLVDIQDYLLDEYQIQKRLWPINAEDSNIGGTDYVMNGIPLYFTALYGIETPLSAYMYNTKDDPSLSTPLYLYFINGRVTYDSTSSGDTWTIYQNFGKLSVLEAHAVKRLKDIIDGAQLRTTVITSPFTGGMVTGNMIVDYICKNGNFCDFCGIEVQRNGTTEKYSTVQYDYEEKNGITHTVAGTIDDFFLTMKEGEATVEINYPYRIDGLFAQFSSGTEPVFAKIPYGELTWDNRYWLDSSKTSSAAVWIYPIKYENGNDFEASDPPEGDFQSNITDALTCGTVNLNDAEKVKVTVGELPDFTLRDITSAIYETACQYGQLDRETDLFSGVELNHSRLYPADSLFPATDLYPDGAALSGFKSMYSKLWADEGNIHKWRYLIITYKGLNEDQQEEDFTLQRTVNNDGTDDYNMSDNWLFRNLVWTAEQVAEYAEAMVAKMQDMTWFPFEMWCAGLPYLETGDEIEIPLNGESYTSYVLQRQLKGIQNLQDTYINGTLDIF